MKHEKTQGANCIAVTDELTERKLISSDKSFVSEQV